MTTIDNMVRELHLSRVDVIKMDIEGAETRALAGAADTIRRMHPMLAIALEHHLNDVDELPVMARHFYPDYKLNFSQCAVWNRMIVPEVAFLN